MMFLLGFCTAFWFVGIFTVYQGRFLKKQSLLAATIFVIFAPIILPIMTVKQ